MKAENPENNECGAWVYILGHKCYRCNHCWRPKDIEKIPKVCPKCKSPYWDRPKEKGPQK
jgi:hypothetical protein